jgi:hypothetical protein
MTPDVVAGAVVRVGRPVGVIATVGVPVGVVSAGAGVDVDVGAGSTTVGVGVYVGVGVVADLPPGLRSQAARIGINSKIERVHVLRGCDVRCFISIPFIRVVLEFGCSVSERYVGWVVGRTRLYKQYTRCVPAPAASPSLPACQPIRRAKTKED